MALESAIPNHLGRRRTQPSKLPGNYDPPFPGFTARFPTDIKDIVMVIAGAQHINKDTSDRSALTKLIDFLGRGPEKYGCTYWEPAAVTDNSGAYNEVIIAYWHSEPQYRSWSMHSGFEAWWSSLNPESEQHGWFLEILLPTVERFETIFSNDEALEGAAHMGGRMSGRVSEHAYWGSMRDRLPVSQDDPLQGTDEGGKSKHRPDKVVPVKKRTRVEGRRNLAVIRSGQDWYNTKPPEREKYLETMHPVLIKGMDFLRDEGNEVGCFSCRFMEVLDREKLGTGTDKTFGLAYFDDLASLEGWSKQHKTHLDIFGRFLQYAKELQNDISLRLFHEVLVLEPKQQHFEYVGCHPKTGMLAAT